MKSFIKKIFVGILTAEARVLVRRTNPFIIAVTGSVGKTSVKDAIYAVLSPTVHVRKNEKSFNSEVGTPLTVLGIDSPGTNIFLWIKCLIEGFFVMLHPGVYPRVLVLEIGIDRPGDMDRITKWIHPDVAVLTRLPDVPVHIEYFNSPEHVASEKLKLLQALKPHGVCVYNNDDPHIVEAVEGILQKSVGYSRYSRSAFAGASETVVHESGMPIGSEFIINTGSSSRKVRVHGGVGVAYVYTYCAAIAVASLFDIPVDDAIAKLELFEPTPGRMRLIPGIKHTTIIDDSYNASPIAVERALEALGSMRNAKRHVAILGDMLELGPYSADAHRNIGAAVAHYADVLITIGVRARGIAESAMRAGLDESNVFTYEIRNHALRDLDGLIEEGDVILVKASQGLRFEKVVEEIMADPDRAEELLVRQDAFWKKR